MKELKIDVKVRFKWLLLLINVPRVLMGKSAIVPKWFVKLKKADV